jgi:hypothetical protein
MTIEQIMKALEPIISRNLDTRLTIDSATGIFLNFQNELSKIEETTKTYTEPPIDPSTEQ